MENYVRKGNVSVLSYIKNRVYHSIEHQIEFLTCVAKLVNVVEGLGSTFHFIMISIFVCE